MRNTKLISVSWIRQHTKVIAGVGMGLVVGAAGSAAVVASIPDMNGVIHACYIAGQPSNVRIIDDSSESCGPGETALNWNQTGPEAQEAHGLLTLDPNTDEFVVTNGNNVTDVQKRTDGTKDGACITVSFEPSNVQVTPWSNNQASVFADVKTGGVWQIRGTERDDPCADIPGANLWVASTGMSRYFLVH